MNKNNRRGVFYPLQTFSKSQDLNYIVERNVAEEKVTENYFRLKFYQYKEFRTCQTAEPVWDGPLQFLSYACENHCTFRIFLEQNSQDSNRNDTYLQIKKKNCQGRRRTDNLS